MSIDEELERLRQENQAVREGLKQALLAIDFLQERVKELEQRQAKDSHNSSLPPPPNRFGRPPKSLWYTVKKVGGQPSHRGHHLDRPELVLMHEGERGEHCQQDLSDLPAQLPERRQIVDYLLKTQGMNAGYVVKGYKNNLLRIA